MFLCLEPSWSTLMGRGGSITQPTTTCMAWGLQMRLNGWQLEYEAAGRSAGAAGVYPKRGKFCVWRRLKQHRGQSDDGRSQCRARPHVSARHVGLVAIEMQIEQFPSGRHRISRPGRLSVASERISNPVALAARGKHGRLALLL